MSAKHKKLKEEIISLSNADNFIAAKAEWKWVGVTYAENWDNCLCSQAIKEVCHIENTENGNVTHVGNNCIGKFLDVDTGSIFKLLKKLINDPNSVIPLDLISYSARFGYIYESEVKFLTDLVSRKPRILSEKQESWRNKIVYRIINKVSTGEN